MAIIDFPSSPSVNDTYSFGNKTWVFNGQGWQLASTGAINGIVIGNTAPAAGNFTTVGAQANITTDQYFIGNGAFLTGIAAGYGNADVANYLPTYTGNLVSLTGNVTTSANISGSYFLGNGAFLTGISPGYSNANVANYLPNYQGLISNVDFRSTSPAAVALVVTDRPLTMGGNSLSYITLPDDGNANSIAAELTNHGLGNVLISAGPADYEWIFDHTGNLSLPGNTFAVNYANGQAVTLTGTYSNVNVKAYLESGATINANFGGGNIITNGTANLGPTIVNGNLSVSGNISATGNITYINVQDLVIDDPLIYLAANNPGDTEDIGIVGSYNDGTYQHTGFVRDHIDDTWKVFTGVTSEPNTIIAWNEAVYAPFKAGPILSNASITANANVVATGNVTGTYLLGNGYYISGIQYSNISGTYGNSNVAAYLPTYTGNLASLTGNVTTTANIQASYLLGNGAFITGLPAGYSNSDVANYLPTYTGNLVSLTGNVITTGNVQGAFLLGNGAFITGLPAGYSNSDVANYLASNAAVTILTTGNITTSANITANAIVGAGSNTTIQANAYNWVFDNTGNLTTPTTGVIAGGNLITANYFAGDGSLLSNINAGNIIGSYGNSQVAAYLQVYNGNALFSNLTVSQDAVIIGNLRVDGNTTYINVTDLVIEDKDIIVAANASATMTDLNGAGLQIGNRSAGGNITFFYDSTSNVMALSHGANIANVLNVSGNVNATYLLGNGYYITGIQYSNINGTYGDSNVAAYLPTYTGNLASLTGNVITTANISGAFLLGNIRSATGGYNDANVAAYTGALTNLTGNVITSANVQGAYILGNGAFLTGVYSNTNVAAYLPTYTGNVGAGNVNLTGNIVDTGALTIITGASGNITLAPNNNSVLIATSSGVNIAGYLNTTGNISAGNLIGSGNNVEVSAGSYNWVFDNAGNLTLAGNTFAVNYANGTAVSLAGTYSNTNVSSYLASNAAVTILTTANITTAANISGNYILGNGALLTGLPATYSNANVANYLPTYTGNVGAGNLNITGNIVDTGALTIITGAAGNIALAPGGTNVLTVTTTGINVAGTFNATGNITAGNLIGSGNNVEITAGSYNWVFDNTGNVTAPANTNIIAANLLPLANNAYDLGSNSLQWRTLYVSNNTIYIGNVALATTANGNLTVNGVPVVTATAGDIITSGNVQANYFLGNGSQLTGISAANIVGAYSNANVANYLQVLTSNVTTSANISGNYLLGNGYFVTGIQYGNITGAYSNTNVLNYLQSGATINANFDGGTLYAMGAANLGSTQVNGNLVVAGNISATGNITYINVQDLVVNDPLIYLGANNTGNVEDLGIVASYNDGTYQHTGFARDYTDGTWKVFQGVTSEPNTVIAWNEAVMAPFKAGPILSNASITANANVVASGNVSGAYLLGNGYFVSGIQYGNITGAYSNATVANYLASNAAVTILTTANITTSANISAGNVVGTGTNTTITTNGYTWAFDNQGNLTAPGNAVVTANVLADYFIGNGAFLTGLPAGYSNADAANYLASNANVTITTTGNITTSANISANYLFGNGSQLTGINVGGNLQVITRASGAVNFAILYGFLPILGRSGTINIPIST